MHMGMGAVATMLALSLSAPLLADEPAPELGPEVEVKAGRSWLDEDGTARFEGEVTLRHGDTTVRAGALRAAVGGPLEVTGQVRLSHGQIYAQASNATLDLTRQKAVLTGSPRLWRGAARLQGERMTIDLERGSVEVDKPRGRLTLPAPSPKTPQADAPETSAP